MIAKAARAKLEDIQSLRALFLEESNFQVRYNACHERGWTDSYLLALDGAEAGYGSIKGQEIADRDTVFEFYLVPKLREVSSLAFAALLAASGAKYIECQSNNPLLSAMLFEFARDISADTVLFADQAATELSVPGAVVRRRGKDEGTFPHQHEPVGDYSWSREGRLWPRQDFLPTTIRHLRTSIWKSGRIAAGEGTQVSFSKK